MLLETLIFFGIVWALVNRFRRCPLDAKPLVQVVVLGDIGHSPRMQYHALSLADTGKVRVELIGFRGSKPMSNLTSNPDISLRYLRQLYIPPSWKFPFVVYAVLKVIFESIQLFFALISVKYRPDCILVQTPPAVPSLLVCGAVSKLSGSKLILDFHNITYMHLESKIKSKPIVRLVQFYEKFLSKFCASSCLCVTKAMKKFLESEFKLESVYTLYDRPGPQFLGRTSPIVKEDLEHRLTSLGVMKKKFSEYNFVIASSTSWTKDEDFSLVLKALPKYSEKTEGKRTLLFITGKGEMKDLFVAGFNALNLQNVDLVTAWLPAADYPLLLGVADIGISVHTSTSGLDLPMKAVDMLGSETPVVALRFPALVEMLGGDGQGGITFSSDEELADALLALTVNEGAKDLREKYSKYGFRFKQSGTWKSEWTSVAWPVFEKYIPKRSRQARRRQGSSSELH